MVTVEQVHADFDTATDRILATARAIISQAQSNELRKKASRLMALGFINAKSVALSNSKIEQLKSANSLIERATYYQQHYPNNKFITRDEVNRLCEKYGLVFGKVRKYIGDIPETNLTELEAFTVKKEDKDVNAGTDALDAFEAFATQFGKNMHGGFFGRSRSRALMIDHVDDSSDVWLTADMANQEPTVTGTRKQKASELMIVAPQTDFDMTNMKVVNNELVPEDPIVLQPVKGGYLIVTKWGPEANDPTLVNEKLN